MVQLPDEMVTGALPVLASVPFVASCAVPLPPTCERSVTAGWHSVHAIGFERVVPLPVCFW